MKSLFVKDGELDFVKIKDIDSKLKNVSESQVRDYLRGEGKRYCAGLKHITPDDFSKAYKILMIFYDKIIGARWEDIEEPRPGYAHYKYSSKEYPFEVGSLPEKFMWWWSQGAASGKGLHGRDGHEMKCIIEEKDGTIDVLSKNIKNFTGEQLEKAL